MPENYFSKFKDPKLITRGNFKRAHHSLRDWVKTISLTKSKPAPGTTAAATFDNVAGKIGDVAGGAGAVASLAGITALTAGTGGLALAIGGLIILGGSKVYQAYSNRDAAHNRMSEHLPNLIDDELPKENFYTTSNKEIIQKVGHAALYLMEEGCSQYELMEKKLELAQDNYIVFLSLFLNEVTEIINEGDYGGRERDEKIIGLIAIWKQAEEPGGPVFEYMRRLIHTSNYLQCGEIISQATFFKMNHDTRSVENADPDPLKKLQQTEYLRRSFKSTGEELTGFFKDHLNWRQVFRPR